MGENKKPHPSNSSYQIAQAKKKKKQQIAQAISVLKWARDKILWYKPSVHFKNHLISIIPGHLIWLFFSSDFVAVADLTYLNCICQKA